MRKGVAGWSAGTLLACCVASVGLLHCVDDAPSVDSRDAATSAPEAGSDAPSNDAAVESGSADSAGDAPTAAPELVTAVGNASTLAADRFHVYWSEDRILKRAPVGGGTAEIFGTADVNIASLAINDRYVVWADPTGWSAKSTGDPPDAGASFRLSGGTDHVAIDDGNTVLSNSTDGIGSCAIGGSSTVISRASGAHPPVVDSSGVYFFGASLDAGSALTLWWCPWPAGCLDVDVPNAALANSEHPIALATGGGYAVWFDALGTLRARRGDGTDSVRELVSGYSDATGLAVGSDAAYFTTTKAVWSVPLAGGNPTLLADQQASPLAIAINPTHVFWIDAGDHTLMRVPR